VPNDHARAEPSGMRRQLFAQGRLADAWLPHDHDQRTAAPLGGGEGRAQAIELRSPTDECGHVLRCHVDRVYANALPNVMAV
jgi:hypothetical protein